MAIYLVSGQTATGVCLESADGNYTAHIQPLSIPPLLVNLVVWHGLNTIWQVPGLGAPADAGMFLILRDTGALELYSGSPDQPGVVIWSLSPKSPVGFTPFFAELDSTPSIKVYAGTPTDPGALISQFVLPSDSL
jgi:hypothetical protein